MLPQTKCPHILVPKFPEFTVDKAYMMFKSDAETMNHLPLLVESKRKPDRDFVFDVLQALHPKYMRRVIDSSRTSRIQARPAKDYE